MAAVALETEVPESLADRTETVLQQAILSGELKPGGRLALPALSQAYGIGVTPLREGLSRLVARGLVTLSGNRGFRVAHISRADLLDITESRILIEQAALAHAFRRQDEAWEDRLVTATHRLLRVIRKGEGPLLEGTPEFDAAHKEFHAALIAGCGLHRLIAIQASLYDAAYRYRRIMSNHRVSRGHACAIHKQLSDLVLARDLKAAAAELEKHLRTTIEVVYDNAAP